MRELNKRKHGACQREKKNALTSKLEGAEWNRERYLEHVRAKASVPSKRVEKVLAALEMQKLERERDLERSLSQAEKCRQERLTEASLSARKHYLQVLERAKEVKLREREAAEMKIRLYHERQEAAAEARRKLSEAGKQHSTLTAALGSKPVENSPKTPEMVMGSSLKDKSVDTRRRRVTVQHLAFDKAVEMFYASGIPSMIPMHRSDSAKNSIQNSLSELSDTVASCLDSDRAPVPMAHQVSMVLDDDSDNGVLPFDEFAELIADPKVLRSVQRILYEIQSRVESCVGSTSREAEKQHVTRYPSRIFLSAYMIVNYPEVVLSGIGTQEAKLNASAIQMITVFDELVKSEGMNLDLCESFDSAWIVYHDQFKLWKSHDAAGLEADLIKAAIELESSRLLKLFHAAEKVRHPVDIHALSQGVDHDLDLIQEKISSLTGDAGVARLQAALASTRAHMQTEAPLSPPRSSHSSPVKKMQKNNTSDEESDGEIKTEDIPRYQWDNLALIWNLLYDPEWRLPTRALELQWTDAVGQSNPDDESIDEEDVSQFEIVSDRIAEKKKWQNMEHQLCDPENDDKMFAVVQVLMGILDSLRSFAPVKVSQSFADQFGTRENLEQSMLPKPTCTSTVSWIDIDVFLKATEWCSKTVLELCAQSRDDEILQAQRMISKQIQEALASSDATALTQAVVASLRMLQLQTRLLGMDVANAHLQALTSQFSRLNLAVRVAYARSKLGHELRLAVDDETEEDIESLKERLPKTRGWLAVASGKIPRIAATLEQETLSDLVQPQPAQTQSLPMMRTGFVAQNAHEGRVESDPKRTLVLEKIDSLHSWRGLVRIGLVHLVSGDGAVGSLSLPETLERDLPRLFDLKNAYQKCVILAICMTVIENSFIGANEIPLSDCRNQKLQAKRRILAILRDPEVSLKDISLEVSACIHAANPQIESFEALSLQIFTILKVLLHRSSQEGRSVVEHLNNMLFSLLFHGEQAAHSVETKRTILKQCQTIGMMEMVDDIMKLGSDIAHVSAVTEAVCAHWYRLLAEEFTSSEQ